MTVQIISACLLVLAWYGTLSSCILAVNLYKFLKLVRCKLTTIPLSISDICGIYAITTEDGMQHCYLHSVLMLYIINTFGYLEYASTVTMYVPSNGPAKSMCTRSYRFEAGIHGCNGATLGYFLTTWQVLHDAAIFSIYSSIPGHFSQLI